MPNFTWARALLALGLLACAMATPAAGAVRIKDITNVGGVRANQLFGVGLVIGLDNTGGRSLATQQLAIDFLRRMNITTKLARQQLLDNVFISTNISMVMVTADLPPFARRGSRIDVTVSVMDDALSLQGGTLVLTPLRAVDGQVYAVAQGPVSIGGFPDPAATQGVHINHPNVGLIPKGAIVEREELSRLHEHGRVRLLLDDPDYATARKIADAINDKFHHAAMAVDAGTVELYIPKALIHNASDFVSEIGLLMVDPDVPARVIIDERTGTVIVGSNVQISAVAIAHGNLVIQPAQPQPADPLGPAASILGIQPEEEAAEEPEAEAAPGALPGAAPQGTFLNPLESAATVADLARALNSLGVSPRDLVAIFQALKKAGALHADLVTM